MGMAFGPWGALAGGIIGALSGIPALLDAIDYSTAEKIADNQKIVEAKQQEY
jgi:hypothetical protein